MKFSPIVLGLSLAVAGSLTAAAQDASTATASAPKYLQVTVEYVKPGKGGMAHDKTEGAYVQAFRKANYPLHYVAFNAMTGRARAIYLTPFNSFEELQNAYKIFGTPGAGADLDRISAADGGLLDDVEVRVFTSEPELSYHPKTPGPQSRFLIAHIVTVRPGHEHELVELVKLYQSVFEKTGSAVHWGAYRMGYGESNDTFVFLTSSNSATEIDQFSSEDSKFAAALNDDDKKKFAELRAASIESDRYEMYSVDPAQSYVTDEWIKADSEFWKPKAAASAAKSAAKSAAQ